MDPHTPRTTGRACPVAVATAAVPRRTGGRRALLAAAALVVACGVNRPQAERVPGPAALPNLRRANQAQLDRIAEETAHVQALTQRLATLRADEDRIYSEVLAAERSYQRLQDDYDGVQGDVSAVSTDLSAVRAELNAQRAELARLQTERGGLEDALRAARAEAEAVAALLAEVRAVQAEDARVHAAWIARLDVHRARHGIEPSAWEELLVELGLRPRPTAPALPEAPTHAEPSAAAPPGDETPPADPAAPTDATPPADEAPPTDGAPPADEVPPTDAAPPAPQADIPAVGDGASDGGTGGSENPPPGQGKA